MLCGQKINLALAIARLVASESYPKFVQMMSTELETMMSDASGKHLPNRTPRSKLARRGAGMEPMILYQIYQTTRRWTTNETGKGTWKHE